MAIGCPVFQTYIFACLIEIYDMVFVKVSLNAWFEFIIIGLAHFEDISSNRGVCFVLNIGVNNGRHEPPLRLIENSLGHEK